MILYYTQWIQATLKPQLVTSGDDQTIDRTRGHGSSYSGHWDYQLLQSVSK